MAQRGAPVYEDFQPTYEWDEENEAYVLYIYVPGFMREQLKIMYVHTSRMIRVHGEKSLGNNRWSRFNQSFPVPDDCEVTKIRAKFQHGILTITLPKLVIPPPSPKPEVKTATPQVPSKAPETPQAPPARPKVAETPPAPPRQEVKPTPQEAARLAPTAKVAEAPPAHQRQETKSAPQEAARLPPTAGIGEAPPAPKQEVKPTPQEADKVDPKAQVLNDIPKPESVPEAIPPKASLADAFKEKADKDAVSSGSPAMATSDHAKLHKDQALEAPRKPTLGTDTGRIVEDKKENSQAGGVAAVGKKTEKVMEKSHVEENGVSKKGKESPVESASQKVLGKVESEKQKPFIIAKEKSKGEEIVATSIDGIRRYAAGTKQAAQGLAKMFKQEDENKQLIVNVGAAAVVIMALGAYISYSFLTRGKDEK